MIHENTRAAVQRRIDAGLENFRIGNYYYNVGLPVTMLHDVDCQLIHRHEYGSLYETYLYLYKGHVYIDTDDMYAAAAKEAI